MSRCIGGLFWDREDDEWGTSYAGRDWTLVKYYRSLGHVSQTGWYLLDYEAFGGALWAGRRIEHALQVATLLVRDEWDRTGLRQPDGYPLWRNRATGEECREPDLLVTLAREIAGKVT